MNLYRTSVPSILLAWLTFVLTLYLLSPTDIEWDVKFIGIVFFLLFFGPVFYLKRRPLWYVEYYPKSLEQKYLLLGLVVQWGCAQYAIMFYTGNSLSEVVQGTLDGANLYKSYQDYFIDSDIKSTSVITRLPAIVSLAAVKIVFILYASLFFQRRIARFGAFILMVSTLAYLLVGLARGTFFEVFEILIAYIYFFYAYNFLRYLSVSKRLMLICTAFCSLLIVPSLFILNTIRRYDYDAMAYFGTVCNNNFCFEPYGLSYYVEYAVYVISVYFSMGLFFMSHLLRMVLEGELINSLIPSYYNVLESKSQGLRTVFCESLDCQFVWVPDVIVFISVFGVFSVLVVFLVHFSLFYLERYAIERFNLFSGPLIYFVVLFLMSLPVGNFYTVSSSNILSSLFFGFFWYVSRKVRLHRV